MGLCVCLAYYLAVAFVEAASAVVEGGWEGKEPSLKLASSAGAALVDLSGRAVAGRDVPGVQDDPVHTSATTDL